MAREFAKKFYKSKVWKDCRAGYINSVNGLCERCLKKKKYKPGYIVHHKTWLTYENINDPEIALGWKNLEFLCLECHNKEHFGDVETVRDGLMFDDEGNLIKKA